MSGDLMMTKPPDGAAQFTLTLASAALFDDVKRADVEALLPRFAIEQFDDTEVFGQGDDSADGHIYVILSGRVRLTRQVGVNAPATVALLGPGDMFGELSAFDPGPRTASATAIGTAHLATVTRDVLLEWAAGRPYIMARLLRVLARRLQRTNHVTGDLIFVDVAGRVAGVLLDLAARFGVPDGEATRVEHGLTQAQLAELVGASRETVNKALQQFVHRGWITMDRAALRILESERLQRRSGSGPVNVQGKP